MRDDVAGPDWSALSEGLGPLPEPAFGRLAVDGDSGCWREAETGEAAFDAEQMRAYATQERAAERERCAQVVEAMQILPGRDFSASDAAEINGMGRAFAKVIRRAPNVPVSAANARLIAAAPDLLLALREIADDYADRFDMDSPSTNPGMKYVVQQARKAIAKATGCAASSGN